MTEAIPTNIRGDYTLTNEVNPFRMPGQIKVAGTFTATNCKVLPGFIEAKVISIKDCPSLKNLPPILATDALLQNLPGIQKLPPGFRCKELLYISRMKNLSNLSEDWKSRDLILDECPAVTEVPNKPTGQPKFGGYLSVSQSGLKIFPQVKHFRRDLSLVWCDDFDFQDTPELTIDRDFELVRCDGVTRLPKTMVVAGDIKIVGYAEPIILPENLTAHNVIFEACPWVNVKDLPTAWTIAGEITTEAKSKVDLGGVQFSFSEGQS